MTFEITPGAAPTSAHGVGASTPDATGFALNAGAAAAALFALSSGAAPSSSLGVVAGDAGSSSGVLDEFIQWRSSGVNLGDRKVRVIDFVDPTGTKMIVTRGVGENRHVITVRSLQQVLVFTSNLYPLEDVGELDIGLSVPIGGFLLEAFVEQLDMGLSIPQSGLLTSILRQYVNWPSEPFDTGLSLPQAGTLVSILRQYVDWPREPLDMGLSLPQSGTLVVVLVSYLNWPAEQMDMGLSIPMSGTLV